ncbi:hypothetical protein ACFE04_027454 [Oxalis oulophora]
MRTIVEFDINGIYIEVEKTYRNHQGSQRLDSTAYTVLFWDINAHIPKILYYLFNEVASQKYTIYANLCLLRLYQFGPERMSSQIVPHIFLKIKMQKCIHQCVAAKEHRRNQDLELKKWHFEYDQRPELIRNIIMKEKIGESVLSVRRSYKKANPTWKSASKYPLRKCIVDADRFATTLGRNFQCHPLHRDISRSQRERHLSNIG